MTTKPRLRCRWFAGIALIALTTGASLARQSFFPFSIQDGRFYLEGRPVFLQVIAYQPLEPEQPNGGEIRLSRVHDDLRRLKEFVGGSDPVALRVYAQPSAATPLRMPKEFYDGVRELGFWIVRDIYFDLDYTAADAAARGKTAIDRVIGEVTAQGGLDRIFSWELATEFPEPGANRAALEQFLGEMVSHVKGRMAETGRSGYSNWVTWTAWPPIDPLRTGCSPRPSGCTPVEVAKADYVSFNAYSYDPERLRDHQAGPVTGTPYGGYLAALSQRVNPKPVVISETGLPDSPAAVGLDQSRIPPVAPSYRRGALSEEQAAEGLRDRYWDARLTGVIAGVTVFEWLDEWWKAGDATRLDSHPEEHFGLARFTTARPYELRFKLQQSVIRDLFTLRLPAASDVITGLTPDAASLTAGATTSVRAAVASGAAVPVRFRWEASAGRIIGEGSVVQFIAPTALAGPVTITAVASDRFGAATRAATSIQVGGGTPTIEITTFGPERSAGRVRNFNPATHKVVVYVETDQYYVQPAYDQKRIWVGENGYWWTTNNVATSTAHLHAWIVPQAFDPPDTLTAPPASRVASALATTASDVDSDLLPDSIEPTASEDRYGDPDGDGATNLEEFLNGTSLVNKDNDADGDSLPDTWERRYFAALMLGALEDPDGDGLTNAAEYALLTHPGRANVDSDADGLPDAWEWSRYGVLTRGADDLDASGIRAVDAFAHGIAPFTDASLLDGQTPVRAAHILELRERINVQLARFGQTRRSWTDATLTRQPIRAIHVLELRAAIGDVYKAAARTLTPFTDSPLLPGATIRSVHILELRKAVASIE